LIYEEPKVGVSHKLKPSHRKPSNLLNPTADRPRHPVPHGHQRICRRPFTGSVVRQFRHTLVDSDLAIAGAAAATSKTSNGRDVCVSLYRVAAPPATSWVQLYTDDKVFRNPTIVRADGDHLLIHMIVAVEGMFKALYPRNFFVYRADLDRPCLWPLPPPSDWWRTRSDHTGIARNGDRFVVASFRKECVVIDIDDPTAGEVESAVLQLYRSGTGRWETKQLDMPYDEDAGLVEHTWQTDAVFSFNGFIGWADYHHGIMLCNVFSPDPELRFVPFPGNEKTWRRDGYGRPTMYRTVSSSRGRLRFVDVNNGCDNRWSVARGDVNSRCSVTTWTLRMPELDEWEMDATLRVQDLWSAPSYRDSHLPRTMPTSPVISLQEANVVHFVVKDDEPGYYGKAWVVTVDMENKSGGRHELYLNPVKGSGIDITNVFLDCPLVAATLSCNLTPDASEENSMASGATKHI
ncbi:hypothetical protein EJB05_04096, partial [Eragrostis curvula]